MPLWMLGASEFKYYLLHSLIDSVCECYIIIDVCALRVANVLLDFICQKRMKVNRKLMRNVQKSIPRKSNIEEICRNSHRTRFESRSFNATL